MADYKEYIVRVYNDITEWRNKEGRLHREDGPAVEFADGDKLWYKNGQLHREDGPAIEEAIGGTRGWYQSGEYYRRDGPSIERAREYKSWYINGKQLTEQEFNSRNKKEFSMDEIAKALGVPVGELKIKKN